MRSLVENLTSLVWWFTAIVAGFLMSLLAAYAKGWLDKWLGAFSESQRHRATEAARKRAAAIERIAAAPDGCIRRWVWGVGTISMGISTLSVLMVFVVVLVYLVPLGGPMSAAFFVILVLLLGASSALLFGMTQMDLAVAAWALRGKGRADDAGRPPEGATTAAGIVKP